MVRNIKYGRICPKCREKIFYTRKPDRNRAEKWNTNCLSCATIGRSFTDEHKKNISESCKGKKHKSFTEETRKNMSESRKGKKRKPFTDEHKKNLRLSAIKNYIIKGRIIPNYNSVACKFIDKYGKTNGYNFRHAENGGEKCIDGYWPDGIDEKRKTIIEIDEKHHFDDSGKLREKDVQRQNYLESLGYKMIRIKFDDMEKTNGERKYK